MPFNKQKHNQASKFANQSRNVPCVPINQGSPVDPDDISKGKPPISYNKSPFSGSAQQRNESSFVQNQNHANKMMLGKAVGDMG
jgi:hypothetical protein